MLSCAGLFEILWTSTHQTPLSMGFSKQECWSGLPFPTPGDLPEQGIEATPLVSLALAGRFFITVPPGAHAKLNYVLTDFLSAEFTCFDKGILKSLITVIDSSISPCISISFYIMHFDILLLGIYILKIFQ